MKGFFTITILLAALFVKGGGSFTLTEINPLHGHSPLTLTSDSAKTYYGADGLTGFTAMNGKLYFTAQGSPGDDELWVTDGTVPGTKAVKEINPIGGAAPGNLVLLNNHILFMATQNDSTWNLWSTDGTDSGTVIIDTLNQWWNTALGPNNISYLGNRLVFCTQDKLLITDGTPQGTDSLLSIADYAQGFGYCELNNQSYFILPELTGDYEFWRTDGTAQGTQQLLDLSDTPYNIAQVGQVLSFNGKIYLSAADSGQSPALFTFDGNVSGQFNRISIGGAANAGPYGFNHIGNDLYFIASNGLSQNMYHISTTDSTPAPLLSNATYSTLSNLCFANNSVYCMDSANNQIHAIEISGFTESTLSLSGYRLACFPDRNAPFLVAANGQIFFEAYDSATNNQVLLQSDFSSTGTIPVMPAGTNTTHPFNCNIGSKITDIFDLTTWNGELILPANFTDAGRELWLFDPGFASSVEGLSTENLFTVFPNPSYNGLTVKTTLCNNCVQQIRILSITGHEILSQTLTGETTTISLSSLAAGNYFVSLEQNGKTAGTKKLVLLK